MHMQDPSLSFSNLCPAHLSFQDAMVVSQKQYFSCSNKSVCEHSGVLEYDNVLLYESFLTQGRNRVHPLKWSRVLRPLEEEGSIFL